ISPSATEKATKSRQQLEQRLASIETARGNIEKRIEQIEDSRSGELIVQLHSSDAEVRMAAAQNLSKKGAKISQTKVNELIDIMRHGDERWETSRSRNEGRHCTDYEYTSIKHYAATALTDMKSRYVSPDVAREARQSKSKGVTRERVTDPGWV
ncbi:MAG: hypothetical protein NTV89_16050, partial [Proteobacteria bacterium]|nr:hypothetical protein [Pseudomonadota bacterium]